MITLKLDEGLRLVESTSLALGFFDGIHTGHRRILQEARDYGDGNNLKSGILTFGKHPVEYLDPASDFRYLTTLDERIRLAELMDLDYFVILPFDDSTFSLSPADFIDNILVNQLNTRNVVVGRDFRFGSGARGDAEHLRQKLSEHGIDMTIVDDVSLDGERISSSSIRRKILKGDMKGANRELGRWYSLWGIVESGKMLGRRIGIPTANLRFPEKKIIPPEGVYCMLILLDGVIYRGAGNVGPRPTFGEASPRIEVHIFDFSGDIYGRKIRIYFLRKIRDIVKFQGTVELVGAIRNDIDFCNDIFNNITRDEIDINCLNCPLFPVRHSGEKQ